MNNYNHSYGYTSRNPIWSQGARCGHIEGKDRAGQYVIGEEVLISYDAGDVHAHYGIEGSAAFAAGYRFGYKLAAEGHNLSPKIVNAPLPRKGVDY